MEIPLDKREKVNDYIRNNFAKVPDMVLRYQALARALPIPPHHISSEMGKLLSILVHSIKAKNILEVGTMWGYSSWWMAQGLEKDGHIITYEKELKHYNLAKRFFQAMKLGNIELIYGDALLSVNEHKDNYFDLIFLDADKKEYPALYPLIKNKLKSGGLLVVDNVIFSSAWKDKTVVDTTDNESILATQAFNKLIIRDKEFDAVPVAINSGLILAVKIKLPS
ncbi:MAG: class I SAM-dependent methyltransferase [Patescibacteria group bacterium]